MGDDAEVHNMLVEHTIAMVLEVEDFKQCAEDRDVDRVGPGLRFVLVPQGGDEINVQGMEVVGSIIFASGIRLVQVGDALAHCQWGLIHCVSSDRVVGGPRAAASGATDE